MLTSLICFSIGVCCYGIKELQSHGKLRWMKSKTGFWDELSWTRKWAYVSMPPDGKFKREAFWGSSTIFVWLTDGYHLMQFFFIKLFVASIILYSPMFSWWVDGVIYLASWYATFNITYKVLSK